MPIGGLQFFSFVGELHGYSPNSFFVCVDLDRFQTPPKNHGSYDDVQDLPIYLVHDLFYPYSRVDVRRPQVGILGNVWLCAGKDIAKNSEV